MTAKKPPAKRENKNRQALVDSIALRPAISKEISFLHPVFAQCFLPARKLKEGTKSYTARHGAVNISISAGMKYDIEMNSLVDADVPYGSAARLVFAHIQNEVVRAQSLEDSLHVNMGANLNEFLSLYGFNSGGKRGKELEQQVYNVASMTAVIAGKINEDEAYQRNFHIAETIRFWREKNVDPKQMTFWQPSLEVSKNFAEVVRDKALPLDMRALIALYENPKAMDVYSWLAYRLPYAKERGEFIPFTGKNGLINVFGSGSESLARFKQRLTDTLTLVLDVYPYARVSVEEKGLRIFKSNPSVPHLNDADTLALEQKEPIFKSLEADNKKHRAEQQKQRRAQKKQG